MTVIQSHSYGPSNPLSAQEFVQSIVKCVEGGDGFVPLVGAGVSMAAGLPGINQLESEYLPHCLARARFGSPQYSPPFRFNPWIDPWPKTHWTRSNAERYSAEFDWIRNLEDTKEESIKALGLEDKADEIKQLREKFRYPRKEFAKDKFPIMLQWLARITAPESLHEKPQEIHDHTKQDDIDGEIIDSFFRHTMSGKGPGLAHRMLAALADPLRIPLSLTTNFDELYERAYDEHNTPYTVFDVHMTSGLPAAYLVLPEPRPIIKMHGGRYGFRADFSLYGEPSLDDRRQFAAYLRGNVISQKDWEHRRDATTGRLPVSTRRPYHLLVMGVSGSDVRVKTLVREAMRALGLRVKLFWVAYSQNDVVEIQKFFKNDLKFIENPKDRLVLLKEKEVGLLLLQLFQRLTHSIPSRAAEFPAIWKMPIPPEPATRTSQSGHTNMTSMGLQTQEWWQNAYPNPPKDSATSPQNENSLLRGPLLDLDDCRLKIIDAPKRIENGPVLSRLDLTSLVSQHVEDLLETFQRPVWFDLDEFGVAKNLLGRCIEAVKYKQGRPNWLSLRPAGSDDRDEEENKQKLDSQRIADYRKMLGRAIHGAGKEWRFIFDASEIPDEQDIKKLDEEDTGYDKDNVNLLVKLRGKAVQVIGPAWTEPQSERLALLIRALTQDPESSQNPGLSQNSKPPLCRALLIQTGNLPGLSTPEEFEKKIGKNDYESIPFFRKEGSTLELRTIVKKHLIDKLEDWSHHTQDGSGPAPGEFLRFLYVAANMRRPRYEQMLSVWPIFQDDADYGNLDQPFSRRRVRSERIEYYISELCKLGWGRRKSGGMLWLHTDLKAVFISLIERDFFTSNESWSTRKWLLPPEATPFAISMHEALGDAYAQFMLNSGEPDALFESLHHRLLCAQASMLWEKSNNTDQRRRYLSAIRTAQMVLRSGRTALLTRGHPQGSCDNLDNLAKRVQKLREDASDDWLEGEEERIHWHDDVNRLERSIRFTQLRLAQEVGAGEKAKQRMDQVASMGQAHGEAKKSANETKHHGAWLNYERAVVNEGRREYDGAQELLVEVFEESTDGYRPSFDKSESGISQSLNTGSEAAWRIIANDQNGASLSSPGMGFLELWIRAQRRQMYLYVLKAEVEYLNSDLGNRQDAPKRDEDPEENTEWTELQNARKCFHQAMAAIRWLPDSMREFAAKENVRQRTIYGFVLAMLREPEEAKRRFNEATAYNAFVHAPSQPQQSAVINIVRAEAVLMDIARSRDKEIRNGFHQLRQRVREAAETRNPLKAVDIPDFDDAIRTKVRGIIDDADQYLDRVEGHLEHRRRDVWWLYRYILCRIKVEEYRHVLRVADVLLTESDQYLNEEDRPKLAEDWQGNMLGNYSSARPSRFRMMMRHMLYLSESVRQDSFALARGLESAGIGFAAMSVLTTHRNKERQPSEYDELGLRLAHEVQCSRDKLKLASGRLGEILDGYGGKADDDSYQYRIKEYVQRIIADTKKLVSP